MPSIALGGDYPCLPPRFPSYLHAAAASLLNIDLKRPLRALESPYQAYLPASTLCSSYLWTFAHHSSLPLSTTPSPNSKQAKASLLFKIFQEPPNTIYFPEPSNVFAKSHHSLEFPENYFHTSNFTIYYLAHSKHSINI